jgi:Cytochrome bd terminal oxidase subunit I
MPSTTFVDLSRFQFATTAAFHMTFPALSVGLAIFLVICYGAYCKTSNPLYLQMFRFWRKIFAVGFEPTEGLDHRSARALLENLRAALPGTTIIAAIHDRTLDHPPVPADATVRLAAGRVLRLDVNTGHEPRLNVLEVPDGGRRDTAGPGPAGPG